jgi:hypothetical protein
MDMWPTSAFGFVGYLQPFPLMAAVAVPILAFIDWSVATVQLYRIVI